MLRTFARAFRTPKTRKGAADFASYLSLRLRYVSSRIQLFWKLSAGRHQRSAASLPEAIGRISVARVAPYGESQPPNVSFLFPKLRSPRGDRFPEGAVVALAIWNLPATVRRAFERIRRANFDPRIDYRICTCASAPHGTSGAVLMFCELEVSFVRIFALLRSVFTEKSSVDSGHSADSVSSSRSFVANGSIAAAPASPAPSGQALRCVVTTSDGSMKLQPLGRPSSTAKRSHQTFMLRTTDGRSLLVSPVGAEQRAASETGTSGTKGPIVRGVYAKCNQLVGPQPGRNVSAGNLSSKTSTVRPTGSPPQFKINSSQSDSGKGSASVAVLPGTVDRAVVPNGPTNASSREALPPATSSTTSPTQDGAALSINADRSRVAMPKVRLSFSSQGNRLVPKASLYGSRSSPTRVVVLRSGPSSAVVSQSKSETFAYGGHLKVNEMSRQVFGGAGPLPTTGHRLLVKAEAKQFLNTGVKRKLSPDGRFIVPKSGGNYYVVPTSTANALSGNFAVSQSASSAIASNHHGSEGKLVYFSTPDAAMSVMKDSTAVKKRQLMNNRRPCNCTKSQCLKLYCDCFANGEFCSNCHCTNCLNNLTNELDRSKAIKSCLERNPLAFQPKIGKGKADTERLHNKGCNCKKSSCLKNYCECYEARVSCTVRCKCYGCRNTEADRSSRNRGHLSNLCLTTASPLSHSYSTQICEYPASSPSSSTEEPVDRVLCKRFPKTFINDEVVEAMTRCLVTNAEEMASKGIVDEATIQGTLIEGLGNCLMKLIEAVSR
uniref:CRC domain-containing protein n=1 Tax=Trichuris muris TaxID=70415 RepID=A0A5S6R3S2_TRIMR